MQSICAILCDTLPLAYKLKKNALVVLLVTLLAPQRKEGYLCFAVCVLTPQQNISVRFWGGHRLAFGDELFPVEKIIPYTCLLLDSPMLSLRVRSCSLLEPEHSRLTPYIPFALLGIVYCHELPGFRCPLQPVRLLASQHTIQRRCVTTYQIRCSAVCFAHEGASLTRCLLFRYNIFHIFCRHRR